MSGGPEVFRRLVRGPSTLVESALRELVQEGVLKETVLRVGRIYHYPANAATRLEILTGFMKQMSEAPARAARPVHSAARESAAVRTARDPDTVRPAPAAAGAAAPSAAEGEKKPFVPQRAVKRGAGEAAVPRPDGSGMAAEGTAAAPVASGSSGRAGARSAGPGPGPQEPSLLRGGGSTPEGEKKPFVPQKARKRDPSEPRVVPRTAGEAAAPAAAAPTPETASVAPGGADAGAAAGEKKPFVPQKAKKRDPNAPRPVPGPPASPEPAATGKQPASFAAAVTDPESGSPAPERGPEGRLRAEAAAQEQTGPPSQEPSDE
jgi:hypothetical protein